MVTLSKPLPRDAHRYLSLSALLLLPSAHAAEEARPVYAAAAPGVSSGNVTQVVISLLLVLAAIVLVGWLLKRMNAAQQGSGNLLKVLGGVSVGQRERIVLVEIKDTWLVVGVGPSQIRTLHTLDKLETNPQDTPAYGNPGNFSAALSSALGALSRNKASQQTNASDNRRSDAP
ncbi:MAG: flagellar biosynthetic protein FliO [Gallionellales bacterium GWA2_60_18]|nr:MAG: flagellar biosynthetic protein FliO [Gallionellales bacterium GWA2_60_18]